MTAPRPVPVVTGLTPDEYEVYRWDEAAWEQRRPHRFVYRYWNDIAPVGHQLLYVGFTSDFWQRDASHKRRSYEWRRQATRIEIDVYPTRESALHAEWLAIIEEVPIHNTAHTDVGRWLEIHGEWRDYVEDRYSPEKLAADKRCADVMEDIMRAS